MNKLPDYIEISKNNLRIILKAGDLSLHAEDIISLLDKIKIKGIINFERISSLDKSNLLDFREKPILIAEAPATLRAESKIVEDVTTLSEWEALFPAFEAAGIYLEKLKTGEVLAETDFPATGFVKAGEIFLSIKTSDIGEDLLGNKISAETIRPILFNSSCIKEEDFGDSLQYYAEKTGYLIFKNSRLSILSPIFDNDKYNRNYIFYPVVQQQGSILSDYNNAINLHREKYPSSPITLPDEQEGINYLNNTNVFIKPVCNGIIPVEGKNAELRIVAQVGKPDGGIDPKNFKHYLTVKKDEIVAEKFHRIEGVEGRDLFGNIIQVKEGKDIAFKVNDLIREDITEVKTIYSATVAGILKITENSINLSEAMIITGSVDFSTGNIDFEKDVFISKDIKPQFKVKSGGDLIVKGSIEDGADIQTKGDLLVDGGIVGKETKIYVGGDATVKFIQDADVYVSGELRVKSSVIGGRVVTGRKLIVIGKKGSRHAQVFGGEYYSFQKMELPSVGSPYKHTKLYCGYNPRIKLFINQAEEIIKSTEIQISRLINSVGFNVTSPAARRIIDKLSREDKEALKEKLLKLKKQTLQLSNLEKKKNQLIERLYSKEPENLEIGIKDYIIPDTLITILKSSREIKKEISSCRIILNEEGIDIVPL